MMGLRATGCTRLQRAARKIFLVMQLVAALCVVSRAQADALGVDRSLDEATRDLVMSRGPETYTALRNIWESWDRVHPDQVEGLLELAASSGDINPAARAYARVLGAYARARRGDLSAAAQRFRELGFVDQWLFVGPFDNEGKAGFDNVFDPEREQGTPLVGGRAYTGKERPVRWRALPDVFRYGWVDVGNLSEPDTNICVYATTFVKDTREKARARPISIWLGSGGAFKLSFNGEQVLSDKAYREHDADRFATKVTLLPGLNQIFLKICGESRAPVFSLRIADDQGNPDKSLHVSARFEDSATLATVAGDLDTNRKPSRKSPRAAGLGVMQQFEALTAKATARAEDLENFARYLLMTHGDDKPNHQARDLTQRALEKAATVRRHLLAAHLAEDRNQRARSVENAAQLLKKEPERLIEVRLAQARVARQSLNWREAFPYYDDVLAIEPDNLQAIRGKVELYNEAGLKRSSLKLLEDALNRSPHSLSLLNMYASQLNALGYANKAKVVESRYSAYRFDDRGYLNSKVTLALARKQRAETEHWLNRLLALDPDDAWTYGTSAKAYRELGQPERATLAYKRALEIAPEEISVLSNLSDLEGSLGRTDEQLALLRKILQLKPQAKDVREYIEHVSPEKPRADEAYAWSEERFLKNRGRDAAGQNRRTLLDLNVTTVFENGLSSKFRQVVFQPLTDSAAAMARQFAFQYEADRERVQLRGARVFRGDGRIDEAFESGEAAANDPSMAMYTSARTFYVQFPRLDPGDVVELRYRVDDVVSRNEFADYFGELVYLQSTEPVSHAEYVLITPKTRKFYIDHQGIANLKLKQESTDKSLIYRFSAEDVPEIQPEPAMPPWSEILGFVHVSTFENYGALGKWYWGLSREQFDIDDETRKLAKDIVKGKTTDLEKVRAVYNWVIKNTRYVALEFGIYGYKPRRCVQTVTRGWGDCKDKATVIVTLLKQLGIDATIVILRTGMRGDFKSKIASLAPFDHAIAYVPAFDLYLDGTAEYTGSTELPVMDQEALAIRVNQGDPVVTRVPRSSPEENVQARELNVVLREDGSGVVDVAYSVRGSAAAQWRGRYQAPATLKERISNDLSQEFPGFALTAVKTGDLNDLEAPVTMRVQGTAPQLARREGSQLSLAVTTSTRLTGLYASLSTRKQDVVLRGFASVDDTVVVRLPQGASVLSTPASAQEESEFGSYSLEVENGPLEVRVRSKLSLKKSRITPEEYQAFRGFTERADRAFQPRLIVGLK